MTATLKDQWKLVLAATRDLRLSRGDLVVLIEVIERYYKTAGNSRASSRYLEKVLGIARRSAIYSLQRLRRHGYLAVARMGHGTRPTEYLPNFALAASGDTHDTTSQLPSGATDCTTNGQPTPEASGATHCTAVVQPIAPLEPASGATHCTESHLLSPADKAGVQVSGTSCEEGTRGAASPSLLAASGAAMPPRDPADAATPAREFEEEKKEVSPLTGFAEVWAAFPRKHQRPKAKAAYAALAADASTHAQLVAAAKALAAHLNEHNVEPQWWPMLHNWLAGERWLEALPAIYQDPKEAAIANRRGSRRHSNEGTGNEGSNSARGLPRGTYHAKIVSAPVSSQNSVDHAALQLEFEIIDGPHQGRRIHRELKMGRAYEQEDRTIDSQLLSSLCHCRSGSPHIKNASDLLGVELSLRIDPELDGGMEFKPSLRASTLQPGTYRAKVVSRTMSSSDKPEAAMQLEFEIIDGPHRGRRVHKELKLGLAYAQADRDADRRQWVGLCESCARAMRENNGEIVGCEFDLQIDPELDGGMGFKPILRAA